MAEYVTTNIRLPKELYRQLKRRALDEEKSLAQVVRESVAQYLTEPRIEGLASRQGTRSEERETDPLWLIGSDSLPADVTDGSTNHDAYLYGGLSDKGRTESEE
jgi:hypothetical protein